MKINWKTIFITIIVFCLVIILITLIISKLFRSISEICCDVKGGYYTFYECYNDGWIDCSKYMTGAYCDFGNGTVIKLDKEYCKDIEIEVLT